METVKMRSPNFDQRGLPDFDKDYIKHTYYEEVRVIDGIAYVNNPDSVQLLEGEGFTIIKEAEKVPKKLERRRKPKLKTGEKIKTRKRKGKLKRKKRKNPRIIYQD